jgi:hypothetical protein
MRNLDGCVVVGELRYTEKTEAWVAMCVDDDGDILRSYWETFGKGLLQGNSDWERRQQQRDWLRLHSDRIAVGATPDDALERLKGTRCA